jgi:hypothetical protein
MLGDPNLQCVAEFLAIYVYHPDHVHNCACDPKIMPHEDLKTAPFKKHSINDQCQSEYNHCNIRYNIPHTATFRRPSDLSTSSRSVAVKFKPAS